MLTASSGQVLRMLNEKIQGSEKAPSETELQAIARSMYEELLSQICDDQRSTPYLASRHSAANFAFIDYFNRLAGYGGHMSLLPGEERKLAEQGWDQQRIEDLRQIILLGEDKGIDLIKRESLDRHLLLAGFHPTDRLRRRLEVALYPWFRDVHVDAQVQLEKLIEGLHGPQASSPGEPARAAPPMPAAEPASVSASGNDPQVPPDWLHCTPTQAAERMIHESPKLLPHRGAGKRARDAVGEQTHRQIRWAATLLEKSLPPGTPLYKVTKADIVALDGWFEKLPVTYGKSPADRDPTISLEAAAAAAIERVDRGELDPGDIGLQTGTTNKHFNKLAQIYRFMLDQIKGAERIDFSKFTQPIDEDEREAATRYTKEQGRAIFELPPWTGCAGLKSRLEVGTDIFHDGLFYVLLLVWYTGARREELCKLMLSDIEEDHGFKFIQIRPTETGRLKNKTARRVVVLCNELIRLGFMRYVHAMRDAGETLLFPELMPSAGTKRKLGDVFYKNWWIYIKPRLPELKRGQAMHAARHMASDELKQQKVFPEFRNDLFGHKGAGEGENRYVCPASLANLSSVVERIPIVTDHIPDQLQIQLLPAQMRKARPRRRQVTVASA